jgi:hypothetical protein
MGFLSGRVTYVRFRVGGGSPLPFDDDVLEAVERNVIGRRGPTDPEDGVSFGWAGGDHVLDATFDLAKNVVNDALHVALRVDAEKIPAALLKAYTKIETDLRARENPSGVPTKAQRAESKEAAQMRAEAESVDGRFRRMAHYPILWDGQSNMLYVGATSLTVVERLLVLFRETFRRELEPVTAGSLAASLAPNVALAPVGFVGGEDAPAAVAWSNDDPARPDHLGNEFLLWLWHTLQNDGETVALGDGSEATVMVAKTLTLDCPRGETGRDCLTNDGPTRLPEAFRALQAGKLPRKAGLIVVRHDHQYELTLQAESLAVSGANLPRVEGASGREVHAGRIDMLRHLVETLDLLYDAFGRRRTGPHWGDDLGRIRRWLQAA